MDRGVTAGPGIRSRRESLEQHHKQCERNRSDAHLLKNFSGDAEAIHGRGHAAIDGRLQEQLLDLFFADAVGDGALHVSANLIGPVQPGEHRKGDDAARLAVQAGPSPDLAEAILIHQLFERAVEIVSRGPGLVGKIGAKNIAADAQAFVEHLFFHRSTL